MKRLLIAALLLASVPLAAQQINGAGATFPYARTMVDFMRWALTDGQKYAPELGYAPLPASVVTLEMEALKRIKL